MAATIPAVASPVNTTVVVNPTAARIQAAIDSAVNYTKIELRGSGTFLMDDDILIDRPIHLVVPHGMTLKLENGWEPTHGVTGETAGSPPTTPHMAGIFTVKAGADNAVLEIYGILDPNFDNTFQEDYPSAGIDLYPEAIWINGAHRVKVTGRFQIINARVGFSVIDSDRTIVEGVHYHTPATTNVSEQTAGFGCEGSYELTVRDCVFTGAYEGFDLNNYNRSTLVERSTFTGHATDTGSRLEANAQAGLTLKDCRLFDMRPLEYEGSGTSEPRFSQRSASHDNRNESSLLIDGLSVVISEDMEDPLFYLERQALDQMTMRNVMVKLTAAQTSAIVYIHDDGLVTGDNVRNSRIDLQVYAPTVTLTAPILDIEPTVDNSTIRLDANIDGCSTALMDIGKPRNIKVEGSLLADTFAGASVIDFTIAVLGRNTVDFQVQLEDAHSSAVMVNTSAPLVQGSVEVKSRWEQQPAFYHLRSLVDAADTSLYTDERFSDFIRSKSPAVWIRNGITDAITAAARTANGTVSQAQPGGPLCWPARGVTFDSATAYHHFGNIGDVGSGSFTALAIVGGITTLSGEDGLGIFSKGLQGSNARYELYIRDVDTDGQRGTIAGAVHNGSSLATAVQTNDDYALNDGKMHLVMLRRSAGLLTIGQDGVAIINSATDISGWDLTNTEELYIGARSTSGDAQESEFGTLGTSAWISQPIIITGYAMLESEFNQLWRVLNGITNF